MALHSYFNSWWPQFRDIVSLHRHEEEKRWKRWSLTSFKIPFHVLPVYSYTMFYLSRCLALYRAISYWHNFIK
jgi:hypothetical protein